ncbi:hypothetical protein BDM02DRAFT_3077537, partial [Thelephora ganbajun]
INRNGWSRPDPMTATKEVICPAVRRLLTVLAFPVGMPLRTFPFFLGCSQISYTSPVVVNIYPGVFTGIGVARGMLGLHNAYLKLSQTVRDNEFPVEMRLRN